MLLRFMLMRQILQLASKGNPGASATQPATSGNNVLSVHNLLKTVLRLDDVMFNKKPNQSSHNINQLSANTVNKQRHN